MVSHQLIVYKYIELGKFIKANLYSRYSFFIPIARSLATKYMKNHLERIGFDFSFFGYSEPVVAAPTVIENCYPLIINNLILVYCK